GLEWDLSDFTSTGNIKVVAATALEEAQTAEILVYPNPTAGKLFVQLPRVAGESHIKLENLDGKLLMEQTAYDTRSLEIELGHLNKGLYIITVHSDGQLMKQKVLLK
ncbi:MAG: T9SS type A sorting domain-containing protein, partial [Bacteroidales bacterium]|nr:T9SS type A sorting domain-containing protein [Bacteroidales bacterium]